MSHRAAEYAFLATVGTRAYWATRQMACRPCFESIQKFTQRRQLLTCMVMGGSESVVSFIAWVQVLI